MLDNGGQYQRWPTSGRISYITPAIWRVTNASQRWTISRMAHSSADWLHNKRADGLHNPCHLWIPGASRQMAHSWADWLHNPYAGGVTNASQRGTISTMAHKWADWLHNPCHLGGPQCFAAVDNIKNGPQANSLAT